jgi:hypothetical protein
MRKRRQEKITWVKGKKLLVVVVEQRAEKQENKRVGELESKNQQSKKGEKES